MIYFNGKGLTLIKFKIVPFFRVMPEIRKFNVSCAVAVYSLCYSVIKSCSYWNSNTLSDVIQYGKRLYENSSLNKYLPLDDLPKTVHVCGTEVSLDLKSDYSERILSVDSKSLLENLVRNNLNYKRNKQKNTKLWIQKRNKT